MLVNPLNHERWYCEDYTNTVLIEGEEYIFVSRPEQRTRQMKMRKSALKMLSFG